MQNTLNAKPGLDAMLNAYVECAFWTAGAEPPPQADLAADAHAKMKADCAAFMDQRIGRIDRNGWVWQADVEGEVEIPQAEAGR